MQEDGRPLTETVYYVLLSLVERRHGYGIMQFVRELTGDRVAIGAGTLYGALSTLQERGWIEPVGADAVDRKKEYRLTAKGHDALASEIGRLEGLVANGRAIMKETQR